MSSESKAAVTESDLSARLQQNDESVLTEVLRTCGPSVAALLRKRFSALNEQDVDDVLAIALFRLWKVRERFDAERASLRTFFYRIAENATRDVFRSGWCKARQLEVAMDAWTEEHFDEPAPAGRPVEPKWERAARDLRAIIDRLPEAYRQIVLSDASARDRVASVEFLSRQLDVPAGTVRVYRHRAMATIRRELRKLGYAIP